MRLGRAMFAVDGAPFTLAEVIAVGLLSGRLDEAFEAVADGLGAEALLEAEGQSPDEAAIVARVDAWRRARMLSSVELTDAWLALHELELDDLVAHVSRALAREAAGPRAREVAPAPTELVLRHLSHAILFDAELEPLVLDVAMRAVAEPLDEVEAARQLRELAAELKRREWGRALGTALELRPSQLERVMGVECSFRANDAQVCSPEAMTRELERERRSLVLVEVARAVFDEEGIALEVIATLRDDGRPLAELSRELGVEPTRSARYVEELRESVTASRVATASVGELVGPELVDGGFAVHQILARTEPTLAAPGVGERLRARLRRRAYAALIERRVRFTLPSR